jgi:hypothetical protein
MYSVRYYSHVLLLADIEAAYAEYIQPRYRPAMTHENNTRSCTYSLDAPDDERKYCSKHVEQSRNIKLYYTVVSCWSFS